MEDYVFQVQIIEDGSCTWTKSFNNAVEAVNTYNSIKDYGFARNTREAMLIEPNGKVHEKAFHRPEARPISVK